MLSKKILYSTMELLFGCFELKKKIRATAFQSKAYSTQALAF
jgi:hypothetical protein